MKKSSFKMVRLAFRIVILVELMRVVFGIVPVVTITVEASIGSLFRLNQFNLEDNFVSFKIDLPFSIQPFMVESYLESSSTT